MSAEVRNDAIKALLVSHLKGKASVSVNLTFTPRTIILQSVQDFIYETAIDVLDISEDLIGLSVSVLIDKSITLLQDNKETTSITPMGKNVVFSQGFLVFPFEVCHDEYVNVSLKSEEDAGNVSIAELNNIASLHRALTNVSKALDVAPPSVSINNGKMYVVYSNVIAIRKVAPNLPNFDVPYSTFNSVVKGLVGSGMNMSVDRHSNVIRLTIGNAIKTYFNFKSPNTELINSVMNKLDSLEYIGSFDFTSLKCIKELDKCYPKEALTLSLYDDNSVSCLVTITDGKTLKVNRKSNDTIINISLSTSQFGVITKMFDDAKDVEVYKGADIICLKNKEQSRILLLSGMTF